MRDVVTEFYVGTLFTLIQRGDISISDKVLVVCGGPLDRKVMSRVGFPDFTITDLLGEAPQDVENLTYEDGSFDLVIVHAGLHHCFSPHRALVEMYRVARKAIIAFEARDSFAMRLAVRLGLTLQYETDSIDSSGKGGVAGTGIPNFVYRWTEREVMKVIACRDPIRVPRVQFFYDLRIPIQRLTRSGRLSLRLLELCVEPLSKLFVTLVPKQCNEFAFAISKDGAVHHWIK